MLSAFVQDLFFAVRQLRKHSLRTVVAIVVLALGLGANAAMFSVVNAVLLQPLPYRDPSRLVQLFERDVVGEEPYNPVAPANYLDWRRDARNFEQIAGVGEDEYNLASTSGEFTPERVGGAFISYNACTTIGVQPVLGRNFRQDEDRPGGAHVAIISYGLWQRHFGGSKAVIGRTIRLDSEDYVIIGVMPRTLVFPSRTAQVWIPLEQRIDPKQLASHENHFLYVIGRLKPGVTLEQARAEIDGLVKQFKNAHPKAVMGKGGNVAWLSEMTVQGIRTSVLVLFGAVICVLLIACVNVANLLLSQALGRQREISIRAAIGASRQRIIGQLLTESVLLSVLGGLVGLMVASFATEFLAAKAPNGAYIPQVDNIAVDYRVFLFTFVIALIVGVLTGLYPAAQASRSDLVNNLKETTRSATSARKHARFRDFLVAAEVALSLVVLVAAGLLLRSFDQLRHVHTGVRTDHTLIVGMYLSDAAYKKKSDVTAFLRRVDDVATQLPGVTAAGLTSCPPAGGHCSDWVFNIEGHTLPPGVLMDALFRTVDPGYFRAAGIPILSGRVFNEQDGRGFDEAHPRPGKIVISESLAKTYFANEDALGKFILGKFILLGNANETMRVQIIGIVADVLKAADARVQPTMYLPIFDGDSREVYLVMHTALEPHSVIPAVRKAIRQLDRDMPLFQMRTTDEIIGGTVEGHEFSIFLTSLFAALALILAAIGMYGVLSYTVSQRTSEIGIRMALGASASEVRRLVLSQGMRPAIIGIVVGIACALALTRLLRSMLFHISTMDPLTFAAVIACLIVVAIAACFIPAVRATRIEPTIALRGE